MTPQQFKLTLHTLIALTLLLVLMVVHPSAQAVLDIHICVGPGALPGGICPGPPGEKEQYRGGSGPNDVKPGDGVERNTICSASGCVEFSANPNFKGSVTPPGWTNPTSPPPTAGPPETVYVCNQGRGATALAACADLAQRTGAVCQSIRNISGVDHCSICPASNPSCGSGDSTHVVAPTSVCPRGYSDSAGTCVVTNEQQADRPADGHCTVRRSGNNFTADPSDPDCFTSPSNTGPAKEMGVNISGNTASAGGTRTGGGANTTVNITNSDSTNTTTITVTNSNSNGTTTTQTVGESAPGSGGAVSVTGTNKTTTQGTGTQSTGTPVNDPGKQAEPIPPCGLPDTAPCKIDETGTPTDGNFNASKDALDNASKDRKAAIENSTDVDSLGMSFGWSLPTGACEPLVWGNSMWERTYNWCPLLGTARDIWGWGLSILAALYIWRRGTSLTGGK